MIKLIVMDVDGTLSDGSIYYDTAGNELKKFSVKDAAGILAAEAVGISCMILTGRESPMVKKRAEELKISYIIQGIKDKEAFLTRFLRENNIAPGDVLYIGDDLNDIRAMRQAGFAGCPADSADEVLELSDYVSRLRGGCGAVRDVIFHFLKTEGVYEKAVSKAYGGI